MGGISAGHGHTGLNWPLAAILGASIIAVKAAASQGVRSPGLSTGKTIDELPVPASGYQVYLLGEMHGIVQNEQLFEQYLIKLNRESGLRDVAIEEDSAYAPNAQDYVEGRRKTVPAPLIYIDRTKQKAILPSTDLTNYRTEAVLLFSGAQPLPDRCSGLN